MQSYFQKLVAEKLQECATRALVLNPRDPTASVSLALIQGEAVGLKLALELNRKATREDIEADEAA